MSGLTSSNMITETLITTETFPADWGLYFRQEKSFRDHPLRLRPARLVVVKRMEWPSRNHLGRQRQNWDRRSTVDVGHGCGGADVRADDSQRAAGRGRQHG